MSDEHPTDDGDSMAGELARGGLRGVIGAMAMTGMRALTISLDLVEDPPPLAILKQRARPVYRMLPRRRRRAVQELMHWGYGAAGGAVFSVVPDEVRKRPWFGPAYGLLVWLGFEMVQAPLMDLKQAKQFRPVERLALALDHMLYGLVLSETRRRARD